MTTRDYLWLTLVVGLGLCLFGRWGWYEEQLRQMRLELVCWKKAAESLKGGKP